MDLGREDADGAPAPQAEVAAHGDHPLGIGQGGKSQDLPAVDPVADDPKPVAGRIPGGMAALGAKSGAMFLHGGKRGNFLRQALDRDREGTDDDHVCKSWRMGAGRRLPSAHPPSFWPPGRGSSPSEGRTEGEITRPGPLASRDQALQGETGPNFSLNHDASSLHAPLFPTNSAGSITPGEEPERELPLRSQFHSGGIG